MQGSMQGERQEEAAPGAAQAPAFLVHNEGDDVAVAVTDVPAGPARVRYLDSDRDAEVDVTEPIPLGHKVALVDLAGDVDVREYGVRVARTRTAIPRGSLAHVHNLRSARWEASR